MKRLTDIDAGRAQELFKRRSVSGVAAAMGVCWRSAKRLLLRHRCHVKERKLRAAVVQRRVMVQSFATDMFLRNGNLYPKYPSAASIVRAIEGRSGRRWSRWAVRRDLLHLGFRARVRRYVPSKDERVIAKRVDFARVWARRACTTIVFSDEHMCSTNDTSCRTQWVRDGDELCPREKRRLQNAVRLHLWGAIGIGFKFLVVLPALEDDKPFRLRSQTYCELCLEPALPLLRGKVLMQDGARPHTARNTLAFLSANNVDVLEGWPPYSPDLNPIENMWALLNRRVSECHPRTSEELLLAVRGGWNAIPQRHVNSLCSSFRRRVARCEAMNGSF
jgi:transposase